MGWCQAAIPALSLHGWCDWECPVTSLSLAPLDGDNIPGTLSTPVWWCSGSSSSCGANTQYPSAGSGLLFCFLSSKDGLSSWAGARHSCRTPMESQFLTRAWLDDGYCGHLGNLSDLSPWFDSLVQTLESAMMGARTEFPVPSIHPAPP